MFHRSTIRALIFKECLIDLGSVVVLELGQISSQRGTQIVSRSVCDGCSAYFCLMAQCLIDVGDASRRSLFLDGRLKIHLVSNMSVEAPKISSCCFSHGSIAWPRATKEISKIGLAASVAQNLTRGRFVRVLPWIES